MPPDFVGHHGAGDERTWWAAPEIDPLAVAWQLWTAPDKSAEFPALSADVSGNDGAEDTGIMQPSTASDSP